MSNSDNSTDKTFHSLYLSDPNVIRGPIILAFTLLFLIVFGVVGNLGIVVLTYRNPRLKNSCNYLLAFLCLSDCFHQLGHVSYIYRMIAGNYFMSLRACFFVQFIPMVGLLLGVVLPMLISLDRLCSFFFSQIHLRINLSAYTMFVLVVCGFYVCSILYVVYDQISENENKLILCYVPDPIVSQPTTNLIFQTITGVVNVIAILSYVAVWTGLRFKKNVSDKTKRAFKALTAIIFALFFGWLTASIGQLVLMSIDAGPLQLFYNIMFSGICINIVASSNMLGLLIFSCEYRNALRQELKRRTSKINSITFA